MVQLEEKYQQGGKNEETLLDEPQQVFITDASVCSRQCTTESDAFLCLFMPRINMAAKVSYFNLQSTWSPPTRAHKPRATHMQKGIVFSS